MARARDLRLGLAACSCFLAGLGLGACFVEAAAPASFRFECSADADCEANEACSNGLCQQPCGGDKDEACPQEAPVCLNSYCASVCPLADDICPSPQTCLAVTLPGQDPGESGLCAVSCSDQNPCADGDLCVEEFGVCVPPCMSTDDCGSGEECLAGFCVPSDSGGGSFP
jgi:hypothetical protein